MGENAVVSVDGAVLNFIPQSKQVLEIPAGLGEHRIEFIVKH